MTLTKYLALALGLMAAPVAAFDLSAMTDEEREAFRTEIRAYLLENPEVIMEAVGVLQRRQQQAEAENDVSLARTYADQLTNDGHSYQGGNPDGDITVVEFLDYRCGYCKKAFPEIEELVRTDGNIRLIVKEFPVLGEQSEIASRFAIAVKQVEGDEAYKSIHDTLMDYRGAYTGDALRGISDTFGYQTDAILAAMGGEAVTKVINDNRLLGQAMQISGTPTFVVQDQMLRGYVPYNQMIQIVAQIREQQG